MIIKIIAISLFTPFCRGNELQHAVFPGHNVLGSKCLSAKPTRLPDVTNASRAIKRCHYNLRCLNDVDVVEADAHKKIRPCKNAPEIYGRPRRCAFTLCCSCSRGKQIFSTPVMGVSFCFRKFPYHPIFDVTRSAGSVLRFYLLYFLFFIDSLSVFEFELPRVCFTH